VSPLLSGIWSDLLQPSLIAFWTLRMQHRTSVLRDGMKVSIMMVGRMIFEEWVEDAE
jgi:hypothetical protein